MIAAFRLGWGLLLVATGCASPAVGESFGTLLTTPEQRARLDSAMVPAGSADTANTGAEPIAVENMQSIRLDGIMISSQGKKEVWINGQPASSGTPAGIRQALIGNDGLATIHLDHARASRSMKPGQLYLPSTGEIQETYSISAGPAEE